MYRFYIKWSLPEKKSQFNSVPHLQIVSLLIFSHLIAHSSIAGARSRNTCILRAVGVAADCMPIFDILPCSNPRPIGTSHAGGSSHHRRNECY